MSESPANGLSRRDLLKSAGTLAAATGLVGMAVPKVHAAESNTIQIALVGCGGRGTGAAANALATKSGPTKLVAMADVFPGKLGDSYKNITEHLADQGRRSRRSQVHRLRRLQEGDGLPAAGRRRHLRHAAGLPLGALRLRHRERASTSSWRSRSRWTAPAPRRCWPWPSSRRQKNLKVGVGLMCRHCEARGELYDRIKDGQIGDIVLLRAYRMAGPTGSAFAGRSRRRHQRIAVSDQAVSRFPLGQRRLLQRLPDPQHRRMLLDEGRLARRGQGLRRPALSRRLHRPELRHLLGRIHLRRRREVVPRRPTIEGCNHEFASYAHGTKGSAVISTSSHTPAKPPIYKGQKMVNSEDLVWAFGPRTSRTRTSSSGIT